MLSTNQKGKLAELKVMAELITIGARISQPIDADSPYDLVVELDRFYRVQVKHGRIEDNCILFASSSPRRPSGGGSFGAADYTGRIDAFAVYCSHDDRCYWVPVDHASKTVTRMRLGPAANGQATRQASDYHLVQAFRSAA